MSRTRAAALLLGASGLVAALHQPAWASCAAPPPGQALRLPEEGLVFAGEVVGTSNRSRVAEVRVLDVWRGRDLPPRVVVVGGETRANVASSGDRRYDEGKTYAFFVSEEADGSLRDGACTGTALLSERRALDPPGVRPPRLDAPAPADPRGGSTWLSVAAAGAAAGSLAAGVLVVRRRGLRNNG